MERGVADFTNCFMAEKIHSHHGISFNTEVEV